MENKVYRELKNPKIRAYHEDNDAIIYVIKIRDNEFMVVHEDAYDLDTGKVEFLNNEQLKRQYGI